MKKSTSWSLLISCLLLSGMVHAQSCPGGEHPIGASPQGQGDANMCAPDDNQQQQSPQPSPPPKWASRWGAIATDAKKGSLGKTTNQSSQNNAEQVALAECQSKGGVTCKIDLAYHDQCAAMLVSPKGYNVTGGATVDIAIQAGMKICTDAGDTNCRVYYSACSLPVQVQ